MRRSLVIALLLAAPIAAQEMEDVPAIGFEGQTLEVDEAAAFGVPCGVLVNEVSAGGPAETAGLRRDDVIVELDGARLTGFEELANRVGRLGIGAELKVTVLRGKERIPMSWKLQAHSEYVKMLGVKAPMIRADGWIGGEAPAIAKLAGRPIVLVVWQNQLPDAAATEQMFLSWHEAYGPKGLVVVPVHIILSRGPGQTASAANAVRYLEAKKFPVPVGHATGERFFIGQQLAAPLIVSDYRLQMVPAVVLIDKEGKIAARWESDEQIGQGEEVRKKIEELLAR